MRRLLDLIDPSWNKGCVSSGLCSGEGLIWAVRDPVRGTNTQGDIEVRDPGVTDKRLLVCETEFGNAFAVMNRDSNTLSPVLRLCWDTGNLRTMAKHSPAVATGAHVSIIGHITKDELRRRMSEAEFFNGFGNRFLWACAQRSKILPDSEGIESAGLGDLVSQLCETAEWGRQVAQMERDPAAGEIWQVIYRQLADEIPGLLGEVLARGDAQTLRLSMIYALADRSRIISEQHLRAAHAVWKYCEGSASFLFGDRLGDPKAEKILAALQEAPRGLTRRDINNNVFKRNVKAEALNDALKLLVRLGRINSQIERTGGRDAERFFICSTS